MTKSKKRAARKAGQLRDFTVPRDDARDTQSFSETARGRRGLERWARRYYDHTGPDSPDDC